MQQQIRRMPLQISRQHVRPAIQRRHGLHLPIITTHSFSQLTVEGIKVPGLCVVSVILVQPIMLYLIVCFATHTVIKHQLILNTMAEVVMYTTVPIVILVIPEELLVNDGSYVL
jgi:hypothetical protein